MVSLNFATLAANVFLSHNALDLGHRKLENIRTAMSEMGKVTLIRRLLLKDKHMAQLADHRRALHDAIAKFQVG